jgi:uncharacterized membrane protein
MALLQVIVRWVHFLTSILLPALFLFELVIVAPLARKLPENIQPLFFSLYRMNCRFGWWAWSVAQIS